jgi:integrase
MSGLTSPTAPWTDAQIRALEPSSVRYTRALGQGLIVHVHPSGVKTFALRRNMGLMSLTLTIGRWPEVKLGSARRTAAAMNEALAQGRDPRELKIAANYGQVPTVREFASVWMKDVVSKDRKDPKPVDRLMKRDILPALGRRPVAKVTIDEVRRLVFARRDAHRPAAAGAIRDTLHRLFSYAVVCGLRPDNPCAAVPARFVYEAKPRERHLSAAELRVVLRKLHNWPSMPAPYNWAVELLLLTMARKSELRLARVEDVDLKRAVWEVPAENSKTGKPHLIPLSPRAVELMTLLKAMRLATYGGSTAMAFLLPGKGSMFVPMSPNAINKALNRMRWGIEAFTPHDLRRTAATILNEQDFDDDWIEAALNHSQKGIRGVYNKARYFAQRKVMMNKWADYLKECEESDAN